MPKLQIHSAYDGMKPFTSAWQAMKFYAQYELNNGSEIIIPCLMPDPGYMGAVSYRKPINDEIIGEPAVVYLHIKRSLETIIQNRLLSATDVQAGLSFARGQVKADAKGMAQSLTLKQAEQMNRSVEKLSAVLLPFLKLKGVIE